MTKRTLSLILVCILAIPILVFPASADMTVYESQLLEDIRNQTQKLTTINEMIRDTFSKWNTWRTQLLDNLALWESGMHQAFSALGSNISSYLDDLADSIGIDLDGLGSSITTGLTTLGDKIQHMEDAIEAKFDHHWNRFTSRWDTILPVWQERYEGIIAKITDFKTSVEHKFDELIHGTDKDVSDSEQFKDDVAQQETEFDDTLHVIETAPSVDLNEYEGVLDSGALILGEVFEDNYLTFISNIFRYEMILFPVAIASVFALLGFLVYGKRF